LAFLHNYNHFNNIWSSVLYFNYNNGFEPPRCKSFIMTFGFISACFFIALDSSAFLFGFGLLLLIFIIICQTPSPTTFTKITTSAANRQDAIVYFTVTLPVPLCVSNPHMQKFCWEREKTKYCPNRIHLINPRHLFIWVCKLVGTRRPQVPLVGFLNPKVEIHV
jgi:nitrate reductase NapE component